MNSPQKDQRNRCIKQKLEKKKHLANKNKKEEALIMNDWKKTEVNNKDQKRRSIY